MKQYSSYEADNPPGALLISRRRQVKGTKPKVKRWTLEELREGLTEYRAMSWEDGRKVPVRIDGFLDWLGERG